MCRNSLIPIAFDQGVNDKLFFHLLQGDKIRLRHLRQGEPFSPEPHMVGQIMSPDDWAVRHDNRMFQDILQFPDVARVVVVLEQRSGRLIESGYPFALLAAEHAEEMFYKIGQRVHPIT